MFPSFTTAAQATSPGTTRTACHGSLECAAPGWSFLRHRIEHLYGHCGGSAYRLCIRSLCRRVPLRKIAMYRVGFGGLGLRSLANSLAMRRSLKCQHDFCLPPADGTATVGTMPLAYPPRQVLNPPGIEPSRDDARRQTHHRAAARAEQCDDRDDGREAKSPRLNARTPPDPVGNPMQIARSKSPITPRVRPPRSARQSCRRGTRPLLQWR